MISISLPKPSEGMLQRYADAIIDRCKSSKRCRATTLFHYLNYPYGFEEAILSGNYAPLPHEINQMTTCFSFAVLLYLVADKLGLDPRFYNIYGLQPHPDDEFYDAFSGDHSFIDVDVGNKNRCLLDRFGNMFGPVCYNLNYRTITVRRNPHTRHLKKKYVFIDHLTKKELINRLMYYRTSEGEIAILECGQRTAMRFKIGNTDTPLWLKYVKPDNRLETVIHESRPLIANFGYCLNTTIDKAGKVVKKNLSIFSHADQGWLQYRDKYNLAEFEIDDLTPFFKMLADLLGFKQKKGEKTRGKYTSDLTHILLRCGIDNFKIYPLKIPPGLDKGKVVSVIERINRSVESQYHDNIKNETSSPLFVALLAREHYRLNLSSLIEVNRDHDGYVYTQTDRDQVLLQEIEDHVRLSTKVLDLYKKNLLREFGIERNRASATVYNRYAEWVNRQKMKYASLGLLRRDDKRAYDETMDLYLYKTGKLKNRSNNDLMGEVLLHGGNPLNAYKHILFKALVFAYQAQTILNHRLYMPKILKKIKIYLNRQTEFKERPPENTDFLKAL